MKLKNLFYIKISKVLSEQRLIQESVENLAKRYSSAIYNIAKREDVRSNSGDGTSLPKPIQIYNVIEKLYNLDPTIKRKHGEQFANHIIKLFMNYIESDYKNSKKFEYIAIDVILSVGKFFELYKELKTELDYPKKIYSLLKFKEIDKLNEYNNKLETLRNKIRLKKETKGFEKMDHLFETDDWDVRACFDEDQMVNTFGGWSDWCISKKTGWWEQYTGQEFLNQENARPGIPVVLGNKQKDFSENHEWICVFVSYEDEDLWEFRDRADINISETSDDEGKKYYKQIMELEEKIVDSLKSIYNVNSIWELGNNKFGDIENLYLDKDDEDDDWDDGEVYEINGGSYTENELYSCFGIFEFPSYNLIPKGWNVNHIDATDDNKYLFLDFIAEFFNDNDSFIVNNDVNLNLFDVSDVFSPINITCFRTVEINEVDGEKLVFLNSRPGIQLLRVNSVNDELKLMSNNTTNVKSAHFGNNINYLSVNDFNIAECLIESGNISLSDCEIKNLTITNGSFSSGKGMSNGFYLFKDSTVKSLFLSNDSDTMCLIDCGEYNVNSKNLLIEVDAFEIYEYKEQSLNLMDEVESISIKSVGSENNDITIRLEKTKSLKEILIKDGNDIKIKIEEDIFNNLEKFEGDRTQIKFI